MAPEYELSGLVVTLFECFFLTREYALNKAWVELTNKSFIMYSGLCRTVSVTLLFMMHSERTTPPLHFCSWQQGNVDLTWRTIRDSMRFITQRYTATSCKTFIGFNRNEVNLNIDKLLYLKLSDFFNFQFQTFSFSNCQTVNSIQHQTLGLSFSWEQYFYYRSLPFFRVWNMAFVINALVISARGP